MKKPYASHVLVLVAVVILCLCCVKAQDLQVGRIALNQVGFYPDGTKLAVVSDGDAIEFTICNAGTSQEVFKGILSPPRKSIFSEKKTRIANFSDFKTPGKYFMRVQGATPSHVFRIEENVFEEVTRASAKAFYFQRFSMALEERYAGRWARPFSHADRDVLIHPSAATSQRPNGSKIASPRGWIDAGDYNKYVVNSGITMGTLLSAYEDFPAYYKSLTLNIPESDNGVPDLLDEVLWNLRWMLTMQDPNDGGVYHKCTNANFDKMVMPHEATSPRFVVRKSTAATLDFAAVTAQAARVYRNFDKEFPGLSDSLRNASVRAWEWAVVNKDVYYDQDGMNREFDPDITTGAYGDNNVSDEFVWAAAELVVTTRDLKFLHNLKLLPPVKVVVPSWNQVTMLGYYSLLRFHNDLPDALGVDLTAIRKQVIDFAEELMNGVDERAYQTVMGASKTDFVWGSNAVAANQAIVLINAFKLTGERKFLLYAMHNLDYLLGRNATGYCFLTGFGTTTSLHIHHRPSEADGIPEPVPGLLAGGPNPEMQDKCTYKSSITDEAYVDDVCSYASNEVAINWNAPFVYLSGAMEATRMK